MISIRICFTISFNSLLIDISFELLLSLNSNICLHLHLRKMYTPIFILKMKIRKFNEYVAEKNTLKVLKASIKVLRTYP